MFSRKTAIALLILVLIVGAVFALWAARTNRTPFSDPAAPRDSPEYERLTSIARSSKPPVSDTTNIVVQRSDTRLTVQIPGGFSAEPENYFVSAVLRASTNNEVRVGDGTVRLAAVAIGYAAPKTNFTGYSIEIPAQLFSGDLRPFSPEEQASALKKWRWNGRVNARGMFPQVRFIFERSNLDELKSMSAGVFDGRTRQPLVTGYNYAAETNIFWYECEAALWHQTPIDIIATTAVGPVETYTMEPRENAELHYPGGTLRLLAIADGANGGFSSSSDGHTNTITVNLGDDSTAGETRSSFVFLSSPTSSDLPMDIELLGEYGKVLQPWGTSSGSDVIVPSVRAAADEVRQIRIRYYPKVYRLAFRIPELPGLPEENRNLKNLLDARVPYMRLEQQWNVHNTLRSLAQMNIQQGSIALNGTNLFFPLIYTNATAQQIFDDISHHLANPEDRLDLDPTKNQIRVVKPPMVVLIEKLRSALSRR